MSAKRLSGKPTLDDVIGQMSKLLQMIDEAKPGGLACLDCNSCSLKLRFACSAKIPLTNILRKLVE